MQPQYNSLFKKGRKLRMICLLLLLVISCDKGHKKETSTRESLANQKYNVLLLIADDLRPEINAYGKSYMHTPHMDHLAKSGLLFERAYVQEATCEPSRNSLLTGLRPDSIGIYGLGVPLKKTKPNILTLPQFFKDKGYETISIGGKVFHNHYEDDSLAWSNEPILVSGKWKGRQYISPKAITEMEAYQKKHPNHKWWGGKGPAFEAAAVADTVYPDGKIANRAINKLTHLKHTGKPFFLALGFTANHLPFNAPEKYWDRYPADKISLPDNYYAPKDTNKYSLTGSGELRGYSNIPKGEDPIPDSTAKSLIRGYRATVSYVDAQIGRVLKGLQNLRLSKNTIVVLWGDHGLKLGEHRSWSKHTNYEVDTRIPLIVRVPDMLTAGQKSKAFVESVDIFPTLAELCGFDSPDILQGRSMVPLLNDFNRPWKPAALSQFPRGDVMGYSMRTNRYRYTEWVNRSTDQIEARELYDHKKDPDENVNVIGDTKRYKPTIDSLSNLLYQRWKQSLTPGGFYFDKPTGSLK